MFSLCPQGACSPVGETENEQRITSDVLVNLKGRGDETHRTEGAGRALGAHPGKRRSDPGLGEAPWGGDPGAAT